MPVLEQDTFTPPLWLRGAHRQTVYAGALRQFELPLYERERLATPDEDFIDLDWSRSGHQQLVVVLHGMEGSADRPYVRGMIQRFGEAGWDGLGLNMRSCSGEMNLQPRFYHSGETSDLHFVLQQIQQRAQYRRVVLIGFSLGGNVVLKYLGERGDDLPVPVVAAACFSVPCDLESCTHEINKWYNSVYRWRFLRSLKEKIRQKARMHPGYYQLERAMAARDFQSFDDAVTAPVHGFKNAQHYWTQSSCQRYLSGLRVPCLLVNAQDDSFLSPACYPFEQAKNNSYLFFQTPRHGGHVGFVHFRDNGHYWSEERALQFVAQHTNTA